MNRGLWIVTFAAGLWCSSVPALDCVPVTEPVAHMQQRVVRIEKSGGAVIALDMRIADEPREQYAGFQHLCPSPPQPPMLFVFAAELLTAFHMRNVHLPLDIAFIAADGRFNEVMRMDPGTRLYAPRQSFRYALEAPAGSFAQLGLAAGARLRVTDVAGPRGDSR